MSRASLMRKRPAEPALTPGKQLADLARSLERLRPCWRDPSHFFEARAELVHQLRSLARELELGHAP